MKSPIPIGPIGCEWPTAKTAAPNPISTSADSGALFLSAITTASAAASQRRPAPQYSA